MRLWLEKAGGDLLVAKLIVNGSLPSYEAASFHAQQAGEKALKALLIRHQIPFTKTHDLGELLRLCEPRAPAWRLSVSASASVCDVVGHVRALLQPYLDAGRPPG